MTEFNVEQARRNMIEQQIRPWEVLDQTVLDVLASTPRELFVPQEYRNLAFADLEIPLGHDQVMMSPKVEARMLQALDIQSSDKVLEIGTGSGYVTACLAVLGGDVDSVDIFEDFTKGAQRRLAETKIESVSLSTGDASSGWNMAECYDVIAVTASLPDYRNCFEQSLATGGRLFVIVGELPVMEAMLVLRIGEKEFTRSKLFETALPPLINMEKKPEFTL